MDHALNWIWQGVAIALATMALMRVLGSARARDRFALCGAALVAVLALPVVTILRASATATGPHGPSEADPVLALPDVWWTGDAALIVGCLAWAGAQALRFAWALLALRRLRASGRPFPPSIESRLRHWVDVRDRGRAARLVVSDAVRSAAVLGCGAPVIAVAPVLLRRLTAEDLDRVIVHEWTHVQRRDDVVHLVQMAARVIAGWHPAVWWLGHQMETEREAACDEAVVAVCGSPKAYAASLITVAALPLGIDRAAPVLGMLASKGLEARVMRILACGRLAGPRRSAWFAAAAAILLCASAFTVGGLPIVWIPDATASRIESGRARISEAPRRQPVAGSAASNGAESLVPVVLPRVGGVPVSHSPRRMARTAHAPARASATSGAPPEARAGDRQVLDRLALPLDQAANGLAAITAGSEMPSGLALIGERAMHAEAEDRAQSAGAARDRTGTDVSEDASPPASRWHTVAAARAGLEKGSRRAATGTAGFLTRFGKRIAASL